ncbi:MAG: Na+/H+ antiporter subunit G, partial [Gammaproteobacteria bacterium]|nr:Na+/H+ antiporter subunit G [Gammaproteobacteria bacterium]
MNAFLEFLLVVFLVVGSFFAFLGSFSLIKLSSFLRRLHGPTKASTMGVGCILLASIIFHTFYG